MTVKDDAVLERVVRLSDEDGRRFEFRPELYDGQWFWLVECGGRFYHSPLTVAGGEQPEFFRALARLAVEIHDIARAV